MPKEDNAEMYSAQDEGPVRCFGSFLQSGYQQKYPQPVDTFAASHRIIKRESAGWLIPFAQYPVLSSFRAAANALSLALVAQNTQQGFQCGGGIRMDDIVIDRMCIVIIRIAVAVGSTAIGLAGGYAVAEHLYYILNGHFHAAHTGAVGGVVDPVLR